MPLPVRLLLPVFLIVGAFGAPAPRAAPQPASEGTRSVPAFEGLRPLVPADGAVVVSRPVFQLAFEGVPPREARRMRFRLELSGSEEAAPSYVFDQGRRRSGWLVTGDGTAVFRPPRPLKDGEYTWRFAAWNGLEWIDAGVERELRVDTVPPAAVEGIRLSRENGSDTVRLVWDPVVLDLNGAAEFVARYHVYRYAQDPDLPHVRAFEVGVVEVPEFTDRPPDPHVPILYYRIAAEDEAGNISPRQPPPPPE